MKIIEAMKQLKELARKSDDLCAKVSQHCADLDFETPLYGTSAEQAATVKGWIQSQHDILKEGLRLRTAIQRTNLATSVTITLGDKAVTKTIAEWIHRRRDLANTELKMWRSLGDRNLKEGQIPSSVPGGQARDVKIRRYYDPRERDAMVTLFASEPGTIDASLEVINATTDLIE